VKRHFHQGQLTEKLDNELFEKYEKLEEHTLQVLIMQRMGDHLSPAAIMNKYAALKGDYSSSAELKIYRL
jgi:hypothetical protein